MSRFIVEQDLVVHSSVVAVVVAVHGSLSEEGHVLEVSSTSCKQEHFLHD
jgi:hypothetical protein